MNVKMLVEEALHRTKAQCLPINKDLSFFF